MAETAKITNAGTCTLWTPWGPQVTNSTDPKLASIRRTLRRLKANKAEDRKGPREKMSLMPECVYEP